MARGNHNHHVLPLFCDDLIASTVDMTPGCFGAYMRILCYAWTRGGVPNDEQACGRIAGGFGKGDWKAIRQRLLVLDAGTDLERLSHPRLELEREAVRELKEAKSKAGHEGAKRRWQCQQPSHTAWQTDGSAMPVPLAKACDGIGKTIAPTPTPTPTPSLREECSAHTHHAGEDFGPEGHENPNWERFKSAWNQTAKAVPWTVGRPPAGWDEREAAPGWLDRATHALAKLPGCEWFERPVAITKFLNYVDRIIAGEFDGPKLSAKPARRSGEPDRPTADQAAAEWAKAAADPERARRQAEYLAAKARKREASV